MTRARRSVAVHLRMGGAALLAGGAVSAAHAGPTVWFEGESLTYSESLSVEGWLNSLRADRFESGGEISFTHNQASLGAEIVSNGTGAWSVALVTRYDASTQYTPDTATLLYASANHLPVFEGAYDLDAQVRETWASGLAARYEAHPLDRLTFAATLTALKGHKLTSGRAYGEAALTEPDLVEGIVALDYRYSDDFVFEREAEEPDGYGATLDVSLTWRAAERLELHAAVEDLWSEIRWSEAPRTIADANSVTSRLGDDGLLRVRPLVEGQRSQTDYNQRYSARRRVRAAYAATDRLSVSQSVLNFEDVYLPTTMLEWKVSETLALSSSYGWKTQAVGLGLGWRGFEASISSDRLNPADALNLHVKIGGVWRF